MCSPGRSRSHLCAIFLFWLSVVALTGGPIFESDAEARKSRNTRREQKGKRKTSTKEGRRKKKQQKQLRRRDAKSKGASKKVTDTRSFVKSFQDGNAVTGSMHLVSSGRGSKVVLDVGILQGRAARGKDLHARMPEEVINADAVVISHVHADHVGMAAKLIKDGYQGRFYMTPATAMLAAPMLLDGARIQERNFESLKRRRAQKRKNAKRRGEAHKGDKGEAVNAPTEPLYTEAHAREVLRRIEIVEYDTPIEVAPGIETTFEYAGHVLGAAHVAMNVELRSGAKRKVQFSGDIGRRGGQGMLRGPNTKKKQVAVSVVESTYGGRNHKQTNPKRDLERIINSTMRRGGDVIIPAFSLGRTQDLVFMLHQLKAEGALPENLPIFIDGPLTSQVTDVFRQIIKDPVRRRVEFNDDVENFFQKHGSPLDHKHTTWVSDVNESKALNKESGGRIIISSSGMATAGRILHHLRSGITNPANTVAIVGYSPPGSIANLIQQGKQVKIHGETLQPKAKVERIGSMSGHADQDGLSQYAGKVRAQKTLLVHGERESKEALKQRLHNEGRGKVKSGDNGVFVSLDD